MEAHTAGRWTRTNLVDGRTPNWLEPRAGRRRSADDGRRIEIHLLKDGEKVLTKLAQLHRTELLSMRGRFAVPDVRAFDH